jgi:hypothetical protein
MDHSVLTMSAPLTQEPISSTEKQRVRPLSLGPLLLHSIVN